MKCFVEVLKYSFSKMWQLKIISKKPMIAEVGLSIKNSYINPCRKIIVYNNLSSQVFQLVMAEEIFCVVNKLFFTLYHFTNLPSAENRILNLKSKHVFSTFDKMKQLNYCCLIRI